MIRPFVREFIKHGEVTPQVVVTAGKVLDEEGKLLGLLLFAMVAIKHLEILSEHSFWQMASRGGTRLYRHIHFP